MVPQVETISIYYIIGYLHAHSYDWRYIYNMFWKNILLSAMSLWLSKCILDDVTDVTLH